MPLSPWSSPVKGLLVGPVLICGVIVAVPYRRLVTIWLPADARRWRHPAVGDGALPLRRRLASLARSRSSSWGASSDAALAGRATVAWMLAGLVPSGGLLCIGWRDWERRTALTLLCGAVLTGFVWISFSGIPLSPGFAAMLPPGPGYVAIGRLLIPASP